MTNDTTVSESQRLIRQHHASHKKQYAKAILLILVAVVAGVVIGVGGTVLYFKNKMHRVPPHPKAIGEAMLEHMHGLMTLNPDEEARVRVIIDEHVGEVEAMRKESFQNIRDVFTRMHGKLETVLGPERMKIWQADREKRFGDKRKYGDRRRH